MNINTQTVREIALENPATTRIFEEFKIDYCCGGRRSIADACIAAGVDSQTVTARLEGLLRDPNGKERHDYAENLSAGELVDYIFEKHHTFTRNEIGRLTPLLEKVCHKHDEHHPELAGLRTLYGALCDDMTTHMRKEEFVLFPYIKELETAYENKVSLALPAFGTVRNPVSVMMAEHDVAGDLLKEIRALTNGFKTPADACPSFKALYHGLEELERDLHRHVHLENNVLFPAAVRYEQECLSRE